MQGQRLSPAPKNGTPCPPSPMLNGGDSGAGTRKRISLSNPGLLAKVCCWVPGMIVFPAMIAVLFSAMFAHKTFYMIGAGLGVYTLIYSWNLSVSCWIGLQKIRAAIKVDWNEKLKTLQAQSPETSSVMHIVFLPNYKEDEDMLRHTLHNLAKSPLARESMYVVLAMEEREGPKEVREKAANLIDSTRHLFADIFATFHADLPGDIRGKSSNSQWAYRQQVQRLAPQLKNCDPSQIFITCCDADTLFHPQYFSCLSYQALQMPLHDRVWSIWQSPILLMRNLFSSPAPTRLSGYATILFELGGMTNQTTSPHLSYSAYTLTFALASHHLVDGWDRDVIAEDHHMWCKCYFASIWDQFSQESKSKRDVKSALRLQPVFLPACSYLVQADGYLESIWARFLQARRHSQGLAELSYVLLQYVHVLSSDKVGRLSLVAHMRTLSVAGKMIMVHVISSLHSLSIILATALSVIGVVQWAWSLGVSGLVALSSDPLLALSSFDGMWVWLSAMFGVIPLMGWIMQTVTYLVVKETLEGKVTFAPEELKKVKDDQLCAPDLQGCSKGGDGFSFKHSMWLLSFVTFDYWSSAMVTLILNGLIPACLAAWSLMFNNGLGFTYIVGMKPKEA